MGTGVSVIGSNRSVAKGGVQWQGVGTGFPHYHFTFYRFSLTVWVIIPFRHIPLCYLSYYGSKRDDSCVPGR